MSKSSVKRGFTLIEIMVAMVVFSIFMGVLFNTYFSLISSNQNADAVRQMYSGARDTFSLLTEDIRLSAIDYNDAQTETYKNKSLYLLSKDGLKRTVYKVEKNPDKEGFFVISKAESYRDALNVGFPESDSVVVTSPQLLIKSFKFVVTPEGDPYSIDSYNIWSNQFQPQVTILATFVNNNESGQIEFPLQTTISSRVYTKIDRRDGATKQDTYILDPAALLSGASQAAKAPVKKVDTVIDSLKPDLAPELTNVQ